MLWSDIRIAFRQFPPGQAARVAAARFCLRLFDKHAAQTYALLGEDRLLSALLRNVKPGFYVDVGANEPARQSNTFALYKKGWRGLTIDANPAMAAWHRRLRPADIQVHAAVSDRETEVTFTEFEESVFSSFVPSFVDRWQRDRKVRTQYQLKTRTLTSILDEHRVPEQFEVLGVDVEGHDLEVLKSLDWRRYHPRFVVVEMDGFNPATPTADSIYAFLLAQRYEMRAFDSLNGYFTPAP